MNEQVTALLPVKQMDQAKSRLALNLSPEQRRELVRCMVQDVLATLIKVTNMTTIVLTSDEWARTLALEFGVDTIDDRGSGETAVIEGATEYLVEQGAAASLVIPGDVPLITIEEIDRILAARVKRGSVLIPSRSGRGTNAVLRAPADLFDLQFGDDSFPVHLRRARETGSPCEVLELEGIGLDVDRVDDLCELMDRQGHCRSQAFLESSGIADRLRAPRL